MIEGFDKEAAVKTITAAVRRACKVSPEEAEAFVRRAMEADMNYMLENDVIDAEGLMGEGEYDDDDAFEALFVELTEGLTTEEEVGRAAQMLDAYMEAQQKFMEESGLLS